MRPDDKTLTVLNTIYKLSKGKIDTPVAEKIILDNVSAVSASFLIYLQNEKYITQTTVKNQRAYILLPRGMQYIQCSLDNHKHAVISWMALIFSAIAATPTIIQAVQWLLSQL